MEIEKQIVMQSPLMIASITLMIAAILKAGNEKGAILVMSGAIGLCLLTLVTPIAYSEILPKVIENMEIDNIADFYMAVGLVVNILWAAAIILQRGQALNIKFTLLD